MVNFKLCTMDYKVGDITRLQCDACVNAANKTLLGGGGVDGAIHRAAGTKLLEFCRGLGGCNTGEAKITPGFNLPAKFVIHTVGPIYSGSEKDPVDLANCYTNSLDLARDNGLKSIAFPCISTGVYGYPAKDAVKVALKAVTDWAGKNSTVKMAITFCCFSEKDGRLYEKALKELADSLTD